MFKLVIIDDELFMRDFLETCINYENLGLNLCGSFCCAEEALDSFERLKPDIVVTDIKMPGMDGIELISRVLKMNEQTRFVVISNYHDFEVVREAFKKGVCDYISKLDFNIESYEKCLMDIVDTINNEEQEKFNKIQEKELELKRRFWSSQSIRTQGEYSYSINMDSVSFCVIKILNYEKIILDVWEMNKELFRYGLTNYLAEVTNHFGKCDFFFNNYDEVVILFSQKKPSDICKFISDISEFFKSHFDCFTVSVMFGDYTEISKLKNAYREVNELQKYRFFCEENIIITKETVEGFKDCFEHIKLLGDFEKLLSNKEYDSVIELLDKISKTKPAEKFVDDIIRFFQNLYLYIRRTAMDYDIEFEIYDNFEELLNYRNCKKVCEYFKNIIDKIIHNLHASDMLLAQQFETYMRMHYEQNINLQQMAAYFKYEYSYFSKLFRRLMGTSFKKYLTNIRLEKAMNLVRESDFKYNEIALMVGYSSYEHFSRSFKEKYNKWPNEIKRGENNS